MLRLVPRPRVSNAVSDDTIEALENLLKRAKAGEVVGLAFAALLPRRRYFIEVTGDAYKDPTFARGMVSAIDDELRSMIDEAAGPETVV